MSEMVERVSRAIAPLTWESIDRECDDPFTKPDVVRTRDQVLKRARAAIAAMREPTEAMWAGLARDIVMWRGFRNPTGRELHAYLRGLGREIPDWLTEEIPDNDHMPPKGTVAACIFKAMIDAVLR